MDNAGEKLRQQHCNTILRDAVQTVGYNIAVSVVEFMAVNDIELLHYDCVQDLWHFHDGEAYSTQAILREVNGAC